MKNYYSISAACAILNTSNQTILKKINSLGDLKNVVFKKNNKDRFIDKLLIDWNFSTKLIEMIGSYYSVFRCEMSNRQRVELNLIMMIHNKEKVFSKKLRELTGSRNDMTNEIIRIYDEEVKSVNDFITQDASKKNESKSNKYLYWIFCPNKIKVGVTKNPNRRMSEFKNIGGNEILKMLVFSCHNKETEILNILSEHRTGNGTEWFHRNEESRDKLVSIWNKIKDFHLPGLGFKKAKSIQK